jgi:hypothetical protein
MSNAPPPESKPPGPRGRFQFGLWAWFLVVFLVSTALAPVAGLLRNGPAKPAARQHLLLVLLAGTPLAVLVALSLFRAILHRGNRSRREDQDD